jgi:TfoX/Sxy family transcriptional regulator of competence genes
MFGGDCFMVDDKMCFGTYQGGLMARVEPEEMDTYTQRQGAEQMIHGGRPMKGYLMIQAEAYDTEEDLEFWIQQCLDFNPKAKSSKKKK